MDCSHYIEHMQMEEWAPTTLFADYILMHNVDLHSGSGWGSEGNGDHKIEVPVMRRVIKDKRAVQEVKVWHKLMFYLTIGWICLSRLLLYDFEPVVNHYMFLAIPDHQFVDRVYQCWESVSLKSFCGLAAGKLWSLEVGPEPQVVPIHLSLQILWAKERKGKIVTARKQIFLAPRNIGSMKAGQKKQWIRETYSGLQYDNWMDIIIQVKSHGLTAKKKKVPV